MIEPNSSLIDDVFQSLQPLTTIDLYRQNAFHILQLPATSSIREIKKRQQIIEISARTGAPIPGGKGSYLQISQIDQEVITRVGQDVQDSLSRFLHEFFWLWPGENQDIPAGCIGLGGIDEQITYWEKQLDDDEDDIVAYHNCAVLYHAAALETERDLMGGEGDTVSLEKARENWELTYEYWSDILEWDDFWSYVTKRVHELDDSQISTSVASRLRNTLPLFLLRLHANILIQIIERNLTEDIIRHEQSIKSESIFKSLSFESIKSIVDPIRNRVKSVCSINKSEVEKDVIHADKVLRSLITQTSVSIKFIAILLPEDSPIIASVCEEVVDTFLEGLLTYFRKTDNWSNSSSLLMNINSHIPHSDSRERIQKTLSFVKDAGKKGNFWRATGYFDLPQSCFNLLETALEKCKREEFDSAINDISLSLNDFDDFDDSEISTCYAVALAFCFNAKGIELFNSGAEIVKRERRSVLRIIENANKNTFAFRAMVAAISKGFLEGSYYRGEIYCMACGSEIHGQYFIIRVNEAKGVICPSCNNGDLREKEKSRGELITLLENAQNCFFTATRLNSANHEAADNFKTTKKIASDLEISISRSKLLVRIPINLLSNKDSSISSDTSTDGIPEKIISHAEEDEKKPNFMKVWFFLLLIAVGIYIFSVMSSGTLKSNLGYIATPTTDQALYAQPTSKNSTTEVRNTVTPTKVVTQKAKPTPTVVTQYFGLSISTLNVRKLPGTDKIIITGIPAKHEVELLGRNKDCSWLKIKTTKDKRPIIGWVSATYIEKDVACSNLKNLP
jgi:hypothetical protein